MVKDPQPAFLFVPHRAGTSRDDRRFINTHLSHRAAERRKKGKPRRQSPPPPVSDVPLPRSELPVRQKPVEVLKVPQCKHAEGFCTGDFLSSSWSEKSSEDDEVEIIRQQTVPIPTSILSNGKGDPFSSTLIPMTPPVRALLHFNHAIFKPWAEGIEKGIHKRAAFHNKFFQTSVQLMQDRTTGYAFLARLASMVSVLTSNQKLAMVATGFKSQAYANLQQRMITNGMEAGTLLYSQMFSLLAMELAAHNFDAAAIHARTLQQLIQNAPMTDCDQVGEDLICSVLWHECLRGGFSLGRPAFEVDKLLDQASMRNTLTSAEIELSNRGLMPPTTNQGFVDAGLSRDLSDCVGELRFMSDLTHAFDGAPELVTEDVMKAFGHRVPLISSSLLTLYNDAQDYLVDGAYPGYESEFHTVAATCLAARFWYRIATSHEWVDGPPKAGFQVYRIYGTHQPVLKRLRLAHESYQESGGVSWRQNLWLWILYVGSLAERANLPDAAPMGKTHRRWGSQRGRYFTLQFVSLARAMGLLSWKDVEEVLATFLYSNAVAVKSKVYFEEDMGELLRLKG